MSPTSVRVHRRNFFARDHRYVLLGTSVLAAIAYRLSQYMPTLSSFLGAGVGVCVVQAVLGCWLVLSLVALVVKLTHWRAYGETPFCAPVVRRALRIASYVVWATVAVVVLDRLVLSFYDIVHVAITQDSNPQDFLSSSIYMAWKSAPILGEGLKNTIIVAILGTLIAFVLALLMLFLRILKPGKRDNDFIKLLKTVGGGFYNVYVTVVRGTPMMVQGLIIYSAGVLVCRNLGMETSAVNAVWTTFRAALITVSLNSTAYLAEVIRASIESIDVGQTEAARSLGLSSWQAMMKVVFPQAVRNAIPAIGNEVIINIKDSSVLSAIGFVELMFATTTVSNMYYSTLEVYVVTALIYLCLTLIATQLLNLLAHRLDMPGTHGVPSSN